MSPAGWAETWLWSWGLGTAVEAGQSKQQPTATFCGGIFVILQLQANPMLHANFNRDRPTLCVSGTDVMRFLLVESLAAAAAAADVAPGAERERSAGPRYCRFEHSLRLWGRECMWWTRNRWWVLRDLVWFWRAGGRVGEARVVTVVLAACGIIEGRSEGGGRGEGKVQTRPGWAGGIFLASHTACMLAASGLLKTGFPRWGQYCETQPRD